MKLASVTVPSRRRYWSSSGYCTWASWFVVSTGPRMLVGLLPNQRCMAMRVAYVNTACGGADVGLFGLSFTFISLSVLQPLTPSSTSAPTLASPRLLYIMFRLSSSEGCLRNDPEVDSDAARIRRHVHLDSLIVPAAVRELRIDVRNVGPHEEIASGQRDTRAMRAHDPACPIRRQVVVQSQLAELHVTCVVDVALGVSEQPVVIQLRRDRRGVRLAGCHIDSRDDHARVVPVILTALYSVRQHAGVF